MTTRRAPRPTTASRSECRRRQRVSQTVLDGSTRRAVCVCINPLHDTRACAPAGHQPAVAAATASWGPHRTGGVHPAPKNADTPLGLAGACCRQGPGHAAAADREGRHQPGAALPEAVRVALPQGREAGGERLCRHVHPRGGAAHRGRRGALIVVTGSPCLVGWHDGGGAVHAASTHVCARLQLQDLCWRGLQLVAQLPPPARHSCRLLEQLRRPCTKWPSTPRTPPPRAALPAMPRASM